MTDTFITTYADLPLFSFEDRTKVSLRYRY
jgi:hypothetical protein